MVKRVPDGPEKSFWQQVVYLADKYAPGLREKVANQRQDQTASPQAQWLNLHCDSLISLATCCTEI